MSMCFANKNLLDLDLYISCYNLQLISQQRYLFFSVERVKFKLAVLKQRKIDGERRAFQNKRTDQYFFIAQKRNSCVFSLFGNNIEYSFSGSSREVHEVSNITLNPS